MSVCEYVCSGSPDFWNKLGFLADEKVAWSARYSSSSLHPLTFSQLFIPTPFFLFKEWGKKHALLLTAFKLSFNLSLSLSLYVVGEMRFHPSVSAKCCYVPEKTYIFFLPLGSLFLFSYPIKYVKETINLFDLIIATWLF